MVLSDVIKDYWIEDGRLLLTTYTGEVTGGELVDGALHKSGDMRFDNVKFILSDWTRASKVRVTPEDVRTLVACLKPISRICPQARMASIVNPDPAGNALVAWYKFLADDLSWDIEIFTSHEDAEAWCSLYRSFLRSEVC